ncbi:hypothetical protein [Nocardiopsis synnemataformans]|uniref:hypothetical protein n=1 Tax=Nocardiopsis synnemataformans TaxID=61305 RepID=UPI003EBD0C1A
MAALVARAEDQAAELPSTSPALWIAGQADREASLAEVITGWIYRLAQVGAWDVLTEYNPDSEGWDAEVMVAWLRTAAATYAHRIEQGTTERVEEAAAAEDVPVALGVVAAGLATAATLHAVTAAAEVLSFGGTDAARASGLTRKTWRTGGPNPRVTHAAQNGETVDIDDVFTNGLRYPGDSAGEVDETAGCHCHLTYSR